MENWSRIQSPDTLYIMPNSPDLEFCSFSYSHQGSPLNPKLCDSYLNVIYARPWELGVQRSLLGPQKSKNKPVTASFLRPLAVKDPVEQFKGLESMRIQLGYRPGQDNTEFQSVSVFVFLFALHSLTGSYCVQCRVLLY